MADEIISVVDESGHQRFLGNLIPPAGLRYTWRTYGVVPEEPLVPRSQWPDLVPDEVGPDDPFLGPAHDQDGIGMCNASATAGCIEDVRSFAGLPAVRLSAGDLYRRICGGRDQGSMLEDGIREAMAAGIAPVSAVPYLDWRNDHGVGPEERRKYLVLEAALCPTFDHCYSAVLKGRRLITGILWYDNYTPDAKGWLPAPRGRAGGHAIRGYKPTRRGNVYGIWHRNSWGPRWGVNGGCFVIPESCYGGGGVGGWWAVRATTQEAGDLPAPRF